MSRKNGAEHRDTWHARSCVLALCALVGCSEPRYGDPVDGGEGAMPCTSCDAGRLDPRQPDARADTSPGMREPDGSSQSGEDGPSGSGAEGDGLLGKYALRMRFYYTDSTRVFDAAQEMVALGTIRRDALGKHQLELTDWCDDHAITVSAAGDTKARLRHSRKYPGRVYDLQVDGDSFSTTGDPVLAGWRPSSPATCTPGARIPAQPGQVWLSGTCTCAVDDSFVPTSQEDCRVDDLDGDQLPGFTVDWTGLLNANVHAVRRDRSRIIMGRFDREHGRHVAQYLASHEHISLSTDCGTCPAAPAPIQCADQSVNAVLFEPLTDDDYSCEAVAGKYDRGEIFTSDQLAPKTDC